ncbi:MAG: sigma 54-interacting transcriptional regulator [Candidatus Krumholzibacteriia bacterium]
MNPGSFSEFVWREACRATTIDKLAAVLMGNVPGVPSMAGLTVLALDLVDGVAETAGSAPRGTAQSPQDSRLDLTPAQTRDLSHWLERTQASLLPEAEPLPRVLLPLENLIPLRPCWAVPLPGDEGGAGLALVALAADDPYLREHSRFLALLREPLAAALQNYRHRRELQDLRRAAEADRQSLLTRLGRDEVLEDVIGADGGLRSVMQRVDMVAGSDVPVLVLGETGSGKEVIARILHTRSRRAGGPFIRVNCGAIPTELVDSELFGHEKGAFTGAVARRTGWFERADGGTLLLDEIGELPRAAQVRLLRVLQDGSMQRVGAESHLRVDVRVIAATHADLAAMVKAGEFREDLWYRLAVFPLLLPPLRDRLQDIPALVDMLARRAARRFGFRPRAPRAEDLAMLAAYPWPGNVRELGSVIDRAVILGEGRNLEIAKALGISTRKGLSVHRTKEPSTRTATGEIAPLDEVIVRHLETALTAARGRIEGTDGAAAMLGLNPNTLRSKLRKHGIDARNFRN